MLPSPWLRWLQRQISPRRQGKNRPFHYHVPSLEQLERRVVLSLSPVGNFTTGSLPLGLAVGDFNADGKLDVVNASVTGGGVSVLLGQGDSTFSGHQDFPTGTSPKSVAVGDFNGDGKLDLAVANYGSDLEARFGNGNGTFQRMSILQPTHLLVITGDFNGDQIRLAVANFGATSSALLGNGDGTFGQARRH